VFERVERESEAAGDVDGRGLGVSNQGHRFCGRRGNAELGSQHGAGFTDHGQERGCVLPARNRCDDRAGVRILDGDVDPQRRIVLGPCDQVGASHHIVGVEPGTQALEGVWPVAARARIIDASACIVDEFFGDHPHAIGDPELGAEHRHQGGAEPGVLRVLRKVAESHERDGPRSAIVRSYTGAVSRSPVPQRRERKGQCGDADEDPTCSPRWAARRDIQARWGREDDGFRRRGDWSRRGDRGNGRIDGLHGGHRRNESVPEFRDGLDEARALFPVAERPPDHPDVLGEVRLLDIAAWPQGTHQLILADQAARALDQQHQGVEDLRRQRNGLADRGQSPLSRIQLKLAEAVN
jgi:hypothetical protein